MNSIQKVRRSFGLSQEALAQLLGISISGLKMAETNKRFLSIEAEAMLDWMVEKVEQMPEFPEVERETATEDLEGLREELVRLRRRKICLEKLLLAEAGKRKQKQGLILFCPDFSQQYPASKYPSAAMQIKALQYNARLIVEMPENVQLTRVRMNLAGINAMIGFLENMM